jgi:hypothetical protein
VRAFAKQNFSLSHAISAAAAIAPIELPFAAFGNNRDDQIVVMGVPDYPTNAAELNAGQSVVRDIRGTGKYVGARGQLTSTRNTDDLYKQVSMLLK